MRATASSLASVVRSRVVLAELQLAVKMASTGRWLTSEARRAVAISACHATAAEAVDAHADGRVMRATMASRRQICDGICIGITIQVEDITPASGNNWPEQQRLVGCHSGGGPCALSDLSAFRTERCIGRNGRRNRIEKAAAADFGPENSRLPLPMPPIFAGRVLGFRPLRRLTFRPSRRILLLDTLRWGFQQRLSRRVAPEESPKDFSFERFFEIEGY